MPKKNGAPKTDAKTESKPKAEKAKESLCKSCRNACKASAVIVACGRFINK